MKYFTYDETKKIYKDATDKGLDPTKVMNELVKSGANFEGIDMEQARQFAGFKPNVIERVKENIQSKGDNFAEAVVGTGKYEDRSLAGRITGGASEAFSAISSTAYNVLPDEIRKLLDKVGGGIGSGINYLSDKISNSKFLQEAVQGDTSKLEEALKIASELGIISGELAGAKGTPSTIKAGGKFATNAGKFVKQSALDTVEPIRTKFGKTMSKLEPKTYDEAVNNTIEAYKTGFVEDKVGINKKLTKLGEKSGKSPDQLIDDLARSGIQPVPEGKLAKFDEPLAELVQMSKDTRMKIRESVSKFDEPTDIYELKQRFLEDINQNTKPSELLKARRELDSVMASYEAKYGKSLSPTALDEIRVESNLKSKAFDAPVYEQDVFSSIGNTVRTRLDEIIPDEAYRNANAELKRIQLLEDTVKIFDNQPINVGFLGTKLGQLTGAIVTGSVAIPTGGAGSLVIAGLFATYGGNKIAQFLRNRKFKATNVKLIQDYIKTNPDVIKPLLDSASKSNAKYIKEQLLLSAPNS